jgi:hypothetical protein
MPCHNTRGAPSGVILEHPVPALMSSPVLRAIRELLEARERRETAAAPGLIRRSTIHLIRMIPSVPSLMQKNNIPSNGITLQ